jgi:uncharacterized protein YkwD
MIYASRAEAAMLLISSMGISVGARSSHGEYPDLIDGEWYTPHMLEAFDRGILDRPEFGLAQPHRQITRSEFLKMLTRAFRLPLGLPNSYTDVQREDWYWAYAGIASRYRLFTSPDTAHLYPNVLVHHFEMSQAIERVLEAHPELRISQTTTPDQSIGTPANQTPFIMGEPHGAAPKGNDPLVQKQYITAGMVKEALMRVLRSNVLIAAQTKMELLQQINAERARRGIPALTLHPMLSNAAQDHAEDMWKRRYFDHITPEGRTYVDRIRSIGYLTARPDQCNCSMACECLPAFALGENIAQGQFTVDQVMNDWLNSTAHRENMLSTEFRDVGFGLFGTIWVQTFGRVEFVSQYR